MAPKKTTRRRKPRRLDAAIAGVLPETVPKRWIKLLVGLFLLPLAWVLSETFFASFARTTLHDKFWATEEFWFFSLGVVLWFVAFFGLPRPMWFYIFGHELTHALWVLIMGGRVHKFYVGKDGGHILADRTNTLIALAPYFVPIYSLIAIALYGLIGCFVDVGPYREILFTVIGITWAFHLTFTCWMIPKGQPDLHYGGTFFSLVVIYILNILLLAILLIIASKHVTWLGFGRDLFQNTVDFTAQTTLLINRLVR